MTVILIGSLSRLTMPSFTCSTGPTASARSLHCPVVPGTIHLTPGTRDTMPWDNSGTIGKMPIYLRQHIYIFYQGFEYHLISEIDTWTFWFLKWSPTYVWNMVCSVSWLERDHERCQHNSWLCDARTLSSARTISSLPNIDQSPIIIPTAAAKHSLKLQ